MKLPNLLQTIVAAALLTNVGLLLSPIFESLWPYPQGLGLRFLLCLLFSCYVGYLLGFAAERKGWVSCILLSLSLFLAAGHISLLWLLVAGGIFLWLSRQLVARRSVVPALVDFGLSAFAVCAFFWALCSSFWLAVWSFFLVQAGSALIPKKFGRRPQVGRERNECRSAGGDCFAGACRVAEVALEQLKIS